MVTALSMVLLKMAPFAGKDIVQIVFALAICGFLLWLLLKYVPMQPPFPQIIMFVVVALLIWWLLSKFGMI